jgi:hypothetical protein
MCKRDLKKKMTYEPYFQILPPSVFQNQMIDEGGNLVSLLVSMSSFHFQQWTQNMYQELVYIYIG